MKNKKIWIGILAFVVIILLAFVYFRYRNRTLSPSGSESLTSGGVTVKVEYSRPSVRGRIIFGSEQQDALQPYGEYWRLGANEPTTVSFNRDVLFNGQAVSAGKYWMYAVPGAEAFEIRLNTDIPAWGTADPEPDKDVLRVNVPVQKTGVPVEQFTISLAPQGDGINMVFEWSDVRFEVPVKVQ